MTVFIFVSNCVYIKNGNLTPKGARYEEKKYQESTQSKIVVESYNSTTIKQCSINTVHEVPLKRKNPKSKQLFPFY